MNYKRQIYTQDDICILNTEISINSTLSGISKIGLSGDINCLLTFESGNIYDFNNYNIYQYKKNDKLQIKCTLANQTYDISINGINLVMGITKPSGYVNYLLLDDTNNQLNILSCKIEGYTPNYEYGILSYTNNLRTGYIKNNDTYSITIFSGDFVGTNIQLASGFTGQILSNATGFYLLSGSGDYNYTYDLITNFGEVTLNGNT